MSDDPIIRGPGTVWIAPVDTPIPESPREVYDPDGPWQLISPFVPDALPEEMSEMEAYGHELLTEEQQQSFILSSSRACPACDDGSTYMTQKENPAGGDSWWFTCANGHATWIGK